MKKVHVLLEDEVYEKIWKIVKKRYISPLKKYHIVINEALKEYLENHKQELEE